MGEMIFKELAKEKQSKGIKALLIEDVKGEVVLLEKLLLNEAGFSDIELVHVDSISNGLEYLRKEKFDVILTDLKLPDSAGLDTFKTLYNEFPGIPILVLTSHQDEELAITVLSEGAQDYIPKSQLDEKVLKRSIRYAIKRQGFLQKKNNPTVWYPQVILQSALLGLLKAMVNFSYN